MIQYKTILQLVKLMKKFKFKTILYYNMLYALHFIYIIIFIFGT